MKPAGPDQFERIVREQIDFVYSAALRQVRDPHLAEDVTQAVFILLQRKGADVPPARLPGWLFNTTRFAAKNAMRIERRRKIHEAHAGVQQMQKNNSREPSPEWDELSPELDRAIARLGRRERDVILLQYIQGQNLTETAAILGISAGAARKRSSRAIENLRKYFAGRGLMVPATMGGLMLANSTQAAPLQLGASILSGARVSDRVLQIVRGVVQAKIMFGLALAGGACAMVLVIASAVTIVAQRSTGRNIAASAPSSAPAPLDLSALRTAQIRVSQGPGGSALRGQETTYFQAGRGIVKYNTFSRGSIIEVDDGRDLYTLRSGATLARRGPSSRPVMWASYAQTSIDTLIDWPAMATTRNAKRDASIDGIACRCFESPMLELGGNLQYIVTVWLDSSDRPRRMQRAYVGRPNETVTIDVTIDQPIDASMFPAIDPAKLQVVADPGYLEKQFPLDGAVYRKDISGLTYAIHQLVQDQSGVYHAVCSLRVSEALRNQIDPPHWDSDFGYCVYYSGKAIPERQNSFDNVPYETERIASMSSGGCRVEYLTIVPRAIQQRLVPQPELQPLEPQPNHVAFAVRVTALREVYAKQSESRVPTLQYLNVDLDTAPPKQDLTMQQAIEQVYREVDRRLPVVSGDLEWTVVLSRTRSSTEQRHPMDMTEEQFLNQILGRIQASMQPR